MGLNPPLWHDFFATIATASAALLGLFIVAISLHLRLVEEHAIVRNQARVSLLLLALALAFSATGLVPGVTGPWLGAEMLLTLVLQIGIYSAGLVRAARSEVGIPSGVWARSVSVVAATTLSAAGAVSLLLQKGPGLYLLVPLLVGGPLGAVYMAWLVILGPERSAAHVRSGLPSGSQATPRKSRLP